MIRVKCLWPLVVVLLVSAPLHLIAQNKVVKAVRVGYLPATHDALLFIALEDKLFPPGIEVQPRKALNSGEILQQLTAGDVDVGIPGIAAPANYISTGSTLLIVGGAATRSAALVVRRDLAKEFPNGTGGNLTKEQIDKIFEMLKGRRVGTLQQSTGDSIFKAAVANRGLAKQIVIERKTSPSEILTGLQGGVLDAGVLWSPHMTRAEELGMPIVLWMYQLMPTHDHVCCRLVCLRAFAQQNEVAIDDFLAGILKAYKVYLEANHGHVSAAVGKYLSPALSDKDLELELYGDPKNHLNPRTSISPDIFEAGVNSYLDGMRDAGILTSEQTALVRNSISKRYLASAYRIAFPRLSEREATECATLGYLHCAVQGAH